MQDLMEFAVEIAQRAGRVAMQYYRDAALEVGRKHDGSPVTAADRGAETVLRNLIANRYPDDAIVGEEHGRREGGSGRIWYLDPVDGTKSFVHGVPLFTTLVACYDADGPLLGVIEAPALGETTWAARGEGAFHDGMRVRVSDTADLAESYVMTSGLEWWSADLRDRALAAPGTLRTWGDGFGYSLVATGRAEAMVDPEVSVWDVAPMPVIISEAGGRLTTLEGGTMGTDSASVVASNGLIHDDLLARLTS